MQDSPVQARAAGRHQVVGPEWLLLSAVPRDIMTVRVCHRRGFKGREAARGPWPRNRRHVVWVFIGPIEFNERPSGAATMQENFLSARTLPRTPVGELAALPQPLAGGERADCPSPTTPHRSLASDPK